MNFVNSPKIKADKISGVESELFSLSMALECFTTSNDRNKFKVPFYSITFNLKNHHATEWVQGGEYEKETKRLVEFVKKHGVKNFSAIKQTMQKESRLLLTQARRLIPLLSSMDSQELASSYNSFVKKYIHYFGLGVITFLYEHIVSRDLDEILKQEYKLSTQQVSGLLQNTYQSFMLDSEKQLVKIKHAKSKDQKRKLAKVYLKNFFFIKNNWRYCKALAIEDVLLEAAHANYKQVKFSKRHIKLKPEHEILVKLLHETEAIHDLRKFINSIGGYTAYRFLDQAVKRSRVPLKIANNILWFEYDKLVLEPKKLLPQLKKRRTATILLYKGRKIYSEKVLVAAKPASKQSELKGTPASAGVVQGKARVILGPKYFNKFKLGEILVVETTRPDYLPIMRKAAAIITDEGGLTSHAAIVCRELGIPCIVGAKTATSNLKDGDLVEVDANKGTIRKI